MTVAELSRLLEQSEDAVLLDTSALDFDASLEALLAIVKERVPL